MIAAIEIVTTETQRCPGCGHSHRLRVALLPDPESSHEVMLGFFRRCPVSQQLVWLVVTLPRSNDGRSWLLQVGPTDDEDWEPEEVGDTLPIDYLASRQHRPSLTLNSGSPAAPPPRGVPFGGLRGRGRAPELLRQALGCPFHP